MGRNERITENIVRKKLEQVGIVNTNGFSVEEQKSENPRIEKLLKSASKSGDGAGKPEFIISRDGRENFLLLVECKADPRKHISTTRDQFKDFAIDGALLYAAHLSREFNVIAIGVSGQTEQDLKVGVFLHPKGALAASELFDTGGVPVEAILPWDELIRYATFDKKLAEARRGDLLRFSRDLHDYLRDYAKVTEAEKPLLVSGVLLALMDPGFRVAYSQYEGERLAAEVFKSVREVIGLAKLGVNQESKKKAIINAFRFIEDHPELQKVDKKTGGSPLAQIVRDIDSEVRPFTQAHWDFDVIGAFYGEFIRYTGGDKQGLGIVLTPKHITELFADIAKLNKNSVVLDTCAGTGGFLIAAMKKMVEGVSEHERNHILEHSLIGVEQEPKMFALAVSNMILRGDGKTNLYQGSCFDEEILKQVRGKATAGFINPPYSQKGSELDEWNFIITLLDSLQKNATGIVIVPMQLSIDQHPLRERLLKEHRLEAVMSMPNDLFYPVASVPCVMVFTAHVPHNSDIRHESWFGYWKDDGFRKDRIEGRIPTARWPGIKENWLTSFSKKENAAGFSVRKKVGITDEWCAEAYLETDYSTLSDKEFKDVVLKYVAFKVRNGDFSVAKKLMGLKKPKVEISDNKWLWFKYDDLFEPIIGRSIDLNKLTQTEEAGNINYVGRTEENNGITATVLNDGSFTVYEPECLTVPMVGNELKSSYQTEPFCVSQNIAILRPKGFSLNVYRASFLNTVIRRDIFRFAYGRTLSLDRLKMLRIKLPTDKSGQPDWQFMEDYIKSLPYLSTQ